MPYNAPPDAPPTSSLDIHDLDTESSDSDIEFAVAFAIASLAQGSRSSERRRNATLSGREYVDQLLNSGHPHRCHDVLRMSLASFLALRTWLLSHTSLRSSRTKTGLSIEEKLVIFIHITARAASMRDAGERFNRGLDCISRLIKANPRLRRKLISYVEPFMKSLMR